MTSDTLPDVSVVFEFNSQWVPRSSSTMTSDTLIGSSGENSTGSMGKGVSEGQILGTVLSS